MRIVLLGDSLTEYGDWERLLPDFTITNLGQAGETVEGLLQRVTSIAQGIGRADYVFVMSGINNIAAGDTEFLVPYREVITFCRSVWPSSSVVIQSILPVCVEWIDSGDIVTVNEKLSRMAQDLQAGYLDVYRRFVDSQGKTTNAYFLDDGIHLSESGYRRWAEALREYLASAKGRGVTR